jgi:5-methyltetrahydropteroyltriglutamate--homocysteine methyltransferase
MLSWLSTIAPSFKEETHHGLGPHPWFSAHRRRPRTEKALESYWKGDLDQNALQSVGRQLRATHWQLQKDAGIDLLPVGDFAWYDQVLTHSLAFGVIPERFDSTLDAHGLPTLDTLFAMARGATATCCGGEHGQTQYARN